MSGFWNITGCLVNLSKHFILLATIHISEFKTLPVPILTVDLFGFLYACSVTKQYVPLFNVCLAVGRFAIVE